MALQYTYTANQLPEAKMRIYPTKVINIIGGPGGDKSLVSAGIIVNLNLRQNRDQCRIFRICINGLLQGLNSYRRRCRVRRLNRSA